MKSLGFQTPRPPNRSRAKETPQSKRSETGSNDPKTLSKSSAFALSEVSVKDDSDCRSTTTRELKIVPKTLNLEFEAVSGDLVASASDPPLFSSDLESSTEDQELTSLFSPESAISSEVIQRGAGSGKVVMSMDSTAADMMTDLLKESIVEFKKGSTKFLESVSRDLGREVANAGRWNDPIFLMKLQGGLSLFLVLTVAVSNFLMARGISARSSEEWDFAGLYPT